MKPLNDILKKYTAGSRLNKSQEMINLLIYMDNVQLFAKKQNELGTLIQAVIKEWNFA